MNCHGSHLLLFRKPFKKKKTKKEEEEEKEKNNNKKTRTDSRGSQSSAC
jgi:hypothetical protein